MELCTPASQLVDREESHQAHRADARAATRNAKRAAASSPRSQSRGGIAAVAGSNASTPGNRDTQGVAVTDEMRAAYESQWAC